MDFRTVVCLISILVSGFAIVILLTQRKSMGCYTERIERSNEGTRRSNELKRQSDERVIEHVEDLGLKAELIAELMKCTHERSA